MSVVSRSSGVVQDDSRAQPEHVPGPSTSSNPAAAPGAPGPDRHVDKLLHNAESLPPITWSNWYREVRWFNLSVIVVTPLIALYGALTTDLDMRTFWFCVFYYVFNMIGGFGPVYFKELSSRLSRWRLPGITAGKYPNASLKLSYHDMSLLGYHRLWAHRSYNASKPLEYFLAIAGGGSVQGAIWWWARGHRSHHR